MKGTLVRTAVKATVFLAISVLCGVMVINTLSAPVPGRTTSYQGVFTDVAGLVVGSDVLIGGVRVGRVTDVRLRNRQALVGFDVQAEQHVPSDTTLVIRYADLLGGRNVSILPGPSGPGGEPALEPGAVVPVDRTRPALDLTTLLNGFRPLFDALRPDQVNQLAGEIIATFQGQGGTVQSLLTRTISVTKDLANRRGVLSGVLRNLNSLVDFTLAHRADFRQLLDSLNQLAGGLAEDRGQIADALDAGSGLATSLSSALDKVRPEIQPLLNSLTAASTTVTHNSGALTDAVARAPALLDTLNRTLDYGSWVNIYVCNLKLDTGVLGTLDLSGGPHSGVCR
jgi:phospholipid/cholesterol/gamma-HCH transport system substrate-binding protein